MDQSQQQNQSQGNSQITCPECENNFDHQMSGIVVGDIIECPICGANLEVVNTEPFEIQAVTTFK
jgi:lysine biosynthesis protein LysW